jgi:phage recombination protein Bet
MDNARFNLTPQELDTLKRTYAKGATDDELALFLTVSKRRGLDPFSGQISFVKRRQKDGDEWKDVGTFVVAIDGWRSLADRTGDYMPGRLPEFEYEQDGKTLKKATAYVKRFSHGEWHEISGVAYWREFAALKDGAPVAMWAKMPHNMLAKCAEGQALRRGFPVETADLVLPETVEQETGEIVSGQYHEVAAAAGAQALPEPSGNGHAAEGEAIPASRSDRLNFIQKQGSAQGFGPSDITKMVKADFMRASLGACTDDELLALCQRFSKPVQQEQGVPEGM